MSDPAGTAASSGFEPGEDGSRWDFRGVLTFDNAEQVLELASALPLPSGNVVDLSQLSTADSSALAVLFALKRRARSEHRALRFQHPPANVSALARVYGVDALLFQH